MSRSGDGLGEGASVASRWRIRHKLMLGLGLVVTAMALVLSGTVFCVWAYYLDMKSLREWTMLLKQADECNAAISDIKPLIEKQMRRKSAAVPPLMTPVKEQEMPAESK